MLMVRVLVGASMSSPLTKYFNDSPFHCTAMASELIIHLIQLSFCTLPIFALT